MLNKIKMNVIHYETSRPKSLLEHTLDKVV